MRLAGWATSNGHDVSEVVTEVGSGRDGKRPTVRRILSDPSATVVVVEHRDRLGRIGVDDLVRDMIGVLTWMGARRYGRGGARNRAMRAVTATRTTDPAVEAA